MGNGSLPLDHTHHESSMDHMFQAETGLDDADDEDDGDGESSPRTMMKGSS